MSCRAMKFAEITVTLNPSQPKSPIVASTLTAQARSGMNTHLMRRKSASSSTAIMTAMAVPKTIRSARMIWIS